MGDSVVANSAFSDDLRTRAPTKPVKLLSVHVHVQGIEIIMYQSMA